MKKIISGMLICTVLLNSFSLIASGEELVKTETTGEAGLVTQATSETTTNSTEDTSSVTEENTSERDSSASSTKEEPLDSSTNSTTEEHSSVSETNTTDSKTEASQSSEVEKKTIDQDEADYQEAAREGTNHKKGTYAMKNGISSRVARATVANVYANDPNLPGKNFIDVSSWNGDISVAEYQKIKSYGVTGVSVKLTEGTWYVNPYAAGQIRNAKAAGLKVSAYHYSMYVSAATAQDEARYFAQAAANSGLDKNTIMFNDAEDPTLTNNGRNAHANSVAFNQQLKALGYKNDALYVGKWWLTAGYIDTSAFGRDRVWVAQYPYTPDSSMQWNNDHGAWQWSSQMYFPGLANYEGRPFDISMTYSNFLNMGNSSGPDLSKYYTTNPGRVIMKIDDTFYQDVAFRTPGWRVKKNTLVTIKGIEYSSAGIPRLVTDQGYLTANKDYVLAAQSNIDLYFTINPKKVRLKSDDYFYADPEFKQRLSKVSKGTIVEVEDLAYTQSGIFRLKTAKGYLTANKNIVEQYKGLEDIYYTSNPGQVITRNEDTYYKDVEFKTKANKVTAGSVLKVTAIEKTKSGIPRLKTANGYYFTANKNYVVATGSWIANYHTVNPGQIIMKNNDNFYGDPDFLYKGAAVSKGSLVPVVGIEYRENQVPRLITQNGYLTANKSYAQKVVPNIKDYLYDYPEYVVMKTNDYYYQDVNFSKKSESVSKDTLIKVLSVDYTENGLPRLKTAKGYITANKTYVTKLISNSDNYFTENPHQIIMRVSDKLYTDVEFSNASRTLSSGTVVPVKGIEYSSNGVPRLKTEEGYLTANKNYVTAAGNTNNNYFVTNPKKVKLLIDDSFYNNVEFTKKGQVVKKNTIVEVEAIEYTNNGIPRLKTNQGYLTANKWYVAKVG